MIKNIIFDMGGVLIRFDKPYFMERLGISKDDMKIVETQVFRTTDWVRMDRGTITDAEAADLFAARVPDHLKEKVRQLVLHWDEPLLIIEETQELVRELKEQGYHIYLLSNASYRQHDYWPRIPASQWFEDTLISCDVRLVKPQPEIYETALQKFGIVAEESVFIDDLPSNCEGAEYTGIRSFVFQEDMGALRAFLRSLGVTVSA